MSIEIPDSYKETLKNIASMGAEEFSQFQVALENSQPTTQPTIFANQVRTSMKVEMADLDETVNNLVGMSIDLEGGRISVETFANDAASVIAAQKKVGFDRATFEKRVVTLLRVESVRISGRASRLQREYENVFSSARILSDIRPVFTATGTEPLGAVIMHNLKIIYYGAAGDSREMFFALDNADLAALKLVIERAEMKSTALDHLIKKSGIDTFDPRKG